MEQFLNATILKNKLKDNGRLCIIRFLLNHSNIKMVVCVFLHVLY